MAAVSLQTNRACPILVNLYQSTGDHENVQIDIPLFSSDNAVPIAPAMQLFTE